MIAAVPAEQAEQIAAVDELHRQPGLVAHDAGAEDAHDVVVVHRGVELRLALEHRAPLGVVQELGQEALDHQLPRLRIGIDGTGDVHLGGAADGEARLQKERAELRWAAGQRPGHASTRRLFARRHSEQVYLSGGPGGSPK